MNNIQKELTALINYYKTSTPNGHLNRGYAFWVGNIHDIFEDVRYRISENSYNGEKWFTLSNDEYLVRFFSSENTIILMAFKCGELLINFNEINTAA